MCPTWVASVDGLTSQNVMPVDGEGLPGKALRKRWCLSFFLKAGREEMDERWPGSLFQTLEATDEKDLDLAISVFRVGIHSDNEEEDRSDRVGTCCMRSNARRDTTSGLIRDSTVTFLDVRPFASDLAVLLFPFRHSGTVYRTLKECMSLSVFKTGLKTWLFKKEFG